jgi:hypothetical protein
MFGVIDSGSSGCGGSAGVTSIERMPQGLRLNSSEFRLKSGFAFTEDFQDSDNERYADLVLGTEFSAPEFHKSTLSS